MYLRNCIDSEIPVSILTDDVGKGLVIIVILDFLLLGREISKYVAWLSILFSDDAKINEGVLDVIIDPTAELILMDALLVGTLME